MDRRAVERRCVQALAGIEIVTPLDVDDLVRQVSQRRGKPLDLLVKPVPEGPTGLTVSLPTRDVLFYEASTSKLHRDHIILHELGHLLLDHMISERLPAEWAAAFLPDLPMEMIERVLGRTVYGDAQEQEAEVMASIITQRAGGFSADAGTAPAEPSSPVLGRFADALGGL